MKLRTFIGRTSSEAMDQVRRAIGEDAIIIATREHPHGGVAVTVVAEGETGDVPPPEGPVLAAPPSPEADETPVAPPFRQGESVADTLYGAFRAHGLPAAIGGELMDLAVGFETSDPAQALAAALERRFRFEPIDLSRAASPIMLVGPPGGGKTQTVGKLAARAAMAGRSVSLINADTDRTGRGAPIAGFAATLSCMFAEAGEARSLNKALAAGVGCDAVLIDAPGTNHLDRDELDALGDCLIDGLVEPVLVLPAGIDPIEAADMAEAYHALGARRAVIARLDAARRLGGALALAHDGRMGLAHFGTGQRIKDGLTDASPRALAQALLPNADAPSQPPVRLVHERMPA